MCGVKENRRREEEEITNNLLQDILLDPTTVLEFVINSTKLKNIEKNVFIYC